MENSGNRAPRAAWFATVIGASVLAALPPMAAFSVMV
jgi:hypothetical protein